MMTELIDKIRNEINKFSTKILEANTAIHTKQPSKAFYFDQKDSINQKKIERDHHLVIDEFPVPPALNNDMSKYLKKMNIKDLCKLIKEAESRAEMNYIEGFYDAFREVIDFMDESVLNGEVSSFRKTLLDRLTPYYDYTPKTYDEYTDPAISSWMEHRKKDFERKWSFKWTSLSEEKIKKIKSEEYEWCYQIIESAIEKNPITLKRPESKNLKQPELQPYFTKDGKDNSIDNIKNRTRKKLNVIFEKITGE